MSKEKYEIKLGSTESIADFDWAASIHMMRRDLEVGKDVTKETWEQVYNEELSNIAEQVDGRSETNYDIAYIRGEGLVDAIGRNLLDSYQRHQYNVAELAEADPRYSFQLQRVNHDVAAAHDLNDLMDIGQVGDQIVIPSPFPEETMREHGKRVTQTFGYQDKRLMGTIQLATKKSLNELNLITLTIDNSDLDAYRAVAHSLGVDIPKNVRSDYFSAYRAKELRDATSESLRGVYDQYMSDHYGGKFLAGRRVGEKLEENAYDFIAKQENLNKLYFSKLASLARNKEIVGKELIEAKQRLTVGYWAALSNRYKGKPLPSGAKKRGLGYEIESALSEAEEQYSAQYGSEITMSACGGSFSIFMQPKLLDNRANNILGYLFGERTGELVYRKGNCLVENCPTQTPKKKKVEVGPCKVCKLCQALFDEDKNPADEHKKNLKSK